jgi:hypothetical protein
MKKTFHYYDIYYKGKMYTSKVESLALAEAEVIKYISEGDDRSRNDFEIKKSDKTFESEFDWEFDWEIQSNETNSNTSTFEIEYTNAFVDIDAEETLILALLENDDSAIQYLRKYIKDIRLVSE